jgi:hypothetical protein
VIFSVPLHFECSEENKKTIGRTEIVIGNIRETLHPSVCPLWLFAYLSVYLFICLSVHASLPSDDAAATVIPYLRRRHHSIWINDVERFTHACYTSKS